MTKQTLKGILRDSEVEHNIQKLFNLKSNNLALSTKYYFRDQTPFWSDPFGKIIACN